MQVLKTLVIALGALIIVSVGLLAWGIYTRVHESASPPVAPSADERGAPLASPSPGPSIGEVRIPLAAGCTAVEMRPHGDRIYVRTGPTGLCERILIIDAATGRLLGDIVLAP